MVRAKGSELEGSGFETCPRKLPPLVRQGEVPVSCKPVLQGWRPLARVRGKSVVKPKKYTNKQKGLYSSKNPGKHNFRTRKYLLQNSSI